MEAYRDQYATIFNNGKGVAVIGISTDDDTVQFNWARDSRFPVYFASDPDAKVVKLYDVKYPLLNAAKRVLFVVGADADDGHSLAVVENRGVLITVRLHLNRSAFCPRLWKEGKHDGLAAEIGEVDRLREEAVLGGALQREVGSHFTDFGALRAQTPGRHRDDRGNGESDGGGARNHFAPEAFLTALPRSV